MNGPEEPLLAALLGFRPDLAAVVLINRDGVCAIQGRMGKPELVSALRELADRFEALLIAGE